MRLEDTLSNKRMSVASLPAKIRRNRKELLVGFAWLAPRGVAAHQPVGQNWGRSILLPPGREVSERVLGICSPCIRSGDVARQMLIHMNRTVTIFLGCFLGALLFISIGAFLFLVPALSWISGTIVLLGLVLMFLLGIQTGARRIKVVEPKGLNGGWLIHPIDLAEACRIYDLRAWNLYDHRSR